MIIGSSFFKKYSAEAFLGIILIAVILFSIPTLTTKPRLWVDEAKSIELARNFLDFGKLDIQTAPEKFTNSPEILQTTGYLVTIPLALVFKFFGLGLMQARIYMLAWMLTALVLVFWIGKKIFESNEAILAAALIASFASFYDSGRTVVGEIPGFAFLLLGIHLWLSKNSYSWAGFWWGLAVVTKPSVFGLLIPAITLVFLLERSSFWGKTSRIAVGMLPAALGWILIVLDHPFSVSAWQGILSFYKNPYSATSLPENIIHNLLNAPFSTTLIYFGTFFVLLVWTRIKEENFKLKSLYSFIIIYSVFAFMYYLRSPGWLRYILIAELLILFVLPSVIASWVVRVRPPLLKLIWEWLPMALVMVLVIVQLLHLFTGAEIFYSDSAIRVSLFLNQAFPNKSIAVLDSPEVAVLLKTRNRFTAFEMTGSPILRENPFLFKPPPDLVVFQGETPFWPQGKIFLTKHYRLDSVLNGFKIFALN